MIAIWQTIGMPIDYTFKLVNEAHTIVQDRKDLILIFESDNGGQYHATYSIDDINKILEGDSWEDFSLSNLIIDKLIELQKNFQKKEPDIDLSQRYQNLLENLTQQAINKIRSPRWSVLLTEETHDMREDFISQFYLDWAKLKPKKPELGPHSHGVEMPRPLP